MLIIPICINILDLQNKRIWEKLCKILAMALWWLVKELLGKQQLLPSVSIKMQEAFLVFLALLVAYQVLKEMHKIKLAWHLTGRLHTKVLSMKLHPNKFHKHKDHYGVYQDKHIPQREAISIQNIWNLWELMAITQEPS